MWFAEAVGGAGAEVPRALRGLSRTLSECMYENIETTEEA